MEVKQITYKETIPFILNLHYAQRIPHIKYSYGLYDGDELIGVCTIGKPASDSPCRGVCGIAYKDKVYELNRLVLIENLPKNTASFFIGAVLRDLKKEDLILLSYADEGMNHYGYIYQATNWYYTGRTVWRTDKYGFTKIHPRHADDSQINLRRERPSKHRYVYFTGRSKKVYLEKLNYKILPYPKGESKRYVLGERKKDKIINKETGEIFYE